MIRLRAQRGALLPMVLVAMVIIALAACAALFTARQDRRASWNTRLQTSALGAADRAHAEMEGALAGIAHTLTPGASLVRVAPSTEGISATSILTRLGPTLFMLVADANARSAQGMYARRRSSIVLRLEPPALQFPAALSITDIAEPTAPATDGSDHVPAGWDCAPARSDTASVRHPSPAPDSATLAAIRRRAARVIPAGTSLPMVQPVVRDGACAIDHIDNWGDPTRLGACGTWMPIIHAAGDLAVDGGVGQGVLLVDGNLTVGGGFRFTGAVVVSGALDVGPGGSTLTGGVTAASITDRRGIESESSIVLRSTCAVAAALLAAGALVPVTDRAWASTRD